MNIFGNKFYWNMICPLIAPAGEAAVWMFI